MGHHEGNGSLFGEFSTAMRKHAEKWRDAKNDEVRDDAEKIIDREYTALLTSISDEEVPEAIKLFEAIVKKVGLEQSVFRSRMFACLSRAYAQKTIRNEKQSLG